jgi:hypothetical protein
MSLFFLAFQAASLLGIISTDLLMKSLTSTTASIYRSVLSLASLDAPYAQDIVKMLKKVDLEFNLRTLDKLLNADIIVHGEKESVKEAIDGVLQVLNKINTGLKEIENSISYHNTKYFANWRQMSCCYTIGDIKKDNKLLEKRTKLLFKLLNYYKTN